MEELIVRATGVRKWYESGSNRSPALRGVDLAVARGECLFLAGPSGSGKTTLLSILGCVLSADEGRVEVLGEDVTRMNPADQARFRLERIGFVFQRFHLFAALTSEENVRVPLDLLGWPAQPARRRSRELLARVGLEELAERRVTKLSTGQRQRVALARALAAGPELVLADEPTASLDSTSGLAAMRLLRDLCRDSGRTVIVVTHDTRIFPLADRILTLVDGRLAEGGEPVATGTTLLGA